MSSSSNVSHARQAHKVSARRGPLRHASGTPVPVEGALAPVRHTGDSSNLAPMLLSHALGSLDRTVDYCDHTMVFLMHTVASLYRTFDFLNHSVDSWDHSRTRWRRAHTSSTGVPVPRSGDPFFSAGVLGSVGGDPFPSNGAPWSGTGDSRCANRTGISRERAPKAERGDHFSSSRTGTGTEHPCFSRKQAQNTLRRAFFPVPGAPASFSDVVQPPAGARLPAGQAGRRTRQTLHRATMTERDL